MTRETIAAYSDSGRETPERQDFQNADAVVGVGDYSETVQRPDREMGDVLGEATAHQIFEQELAYLEGAGVEAYLVPGNQDDMEDEGFRGAIDETSNVSFLEYDAVHVGEDLVVVAGGSYAHPELPIYADDFEREIGLPATSSLDVSEYEDVNELMEDVIAEEEEMLPTSVGDALQDDNLADLVSPESRQIIGRRAAIEQRVQHINSILDGVDSSKNIVFAHHGVPNGADINNYDLDLIRNPGTHVDGKNYGSLVSRQVVEQNPNKLDAGVFGHFENQGGRSEINGVPVFNVAKEWTDLTFTEDGLVDTEHQQL